MDLESYETIDVPCSEELLGTISENDNVEYWNVEGEKIVKRKV
jgi:translation elongation factor P/translation initiation factor 5A